MKKAKKPVISEKKLIKSTLVILSLLIMLFTTWMSEPLWEKPLSFEGEAPQLFSNQIGDDLENAHVQAILKAKKSVLLMIFSLTKDSVIHALRQKSEEGLSVKVICDAKASPHIMQKLGSNAQVIRRFSKGLMHLKILVVDNEECWVGSANMTHESLNMHGNLVVAMRNPLLAQTLVEKALTLKEYDREGNVPYHTFLISGQKIELSFLPDDRKGCIRIKELIRSAKKCIKIAMFTWTRFDLIKELVQAKKRGVQVDVVLGNSSAKGASAKVAALLKKENISLAFSHSGPALLHHKFMWIDDELLEVGSANWTKAAFSQNDDCFLILHDLTQEQQNRMESLWKVIKKESVTNFQV